MEYNSLYKERKSKEQQEKKKELMCVYAYNDGGNVRKRVQGMRGVGAESVCCIREQEESDARGVGAKSDSKARLSRNGCFGR